MAESIILVFKLRKQENCFFAFISLEDGSEVVDDDLPFIKREIGHLSQANGLDGVIRDGEIIDKGVSADDGEIEIGKVLLRMLECNAE